MDLHTPVSQVGRSYKMYASRLERLNILTVGDFLFHIPTRYDDYSKITTISHIRPGDVVTIQGKLISIDSQLLRSRKVMQKGLVSDDTGTIEVIWFNQPFLTKYLHPGDVLSLSGKIDWFSQHLSLQSPDYEVIKEGIVPLHTGRLVPIYAETHGVSSKWLRRQIYKIIQEQKQSLIEHLPQHVLDTNGFMGFVEAIEQIHFPTSPESAARARLRLAFDEVFLMQLKALNRRQLWKRDLVSNVLGTNAFQNEIQIFFEKLPFELTNSQKKAVHDIFTDIASDKPMNRLLEGDVGSGKTVVAAIAMYVTCLNGFQSVLMAPTEILAKQHYTTISSLLVPLGIRVGLATGSQKIGIEKNDFDILIGTHAVLSQKINFTNLALVVIDEQQRFGVNQRAIIRQKGKNPHLLTMTATPIPRTIALTLYGDLDLSYLDEMPKGRKMVKTWLVPPEKRENAYAWITNQLLTTDSQAFIICPFIEESESMQTVRAAAKEFEYLQKEVFTKTKLGLLHGKLKNKEKDQALANFKDKQFDILVATPVVEVGIDIPNATIMVIEATERFGLAQLHQLRGRVGRGDKQSYCLLFTESKNPQTLERLKAMERMHTGFALAELDLKLRGPGELFGTMQHGTQELKVAHFSDTPLIEQARREAEEIFAHLKDYPKLVEKLQEEQSDAVSPD